MNATEEIAPPKATFSRLSPVFVVDRIEPCLEFWVDRLGFETRLQVPGDDGLEFAILGRDDVEVIYRSRESLDLDAPGIADGGGPATTIMYVEVDDLEALAPRLAGADVVVPLRQTCFGTLEMYVNEPSGRIVALTSAA
jgi:uncharacterized glyoxalase superfamily protein PhnB